METRPSVLVLASLDETREVLHTVLEQRGVPTYTTRRPDEALTWAQRHRPRLVVVDLDVNAGQGAETARRLQALNAGDRPSVVMLGTVRRAYRPTVRGEFVAKPYHYATLVRKIEELLEGERRSRPIDSNPSSDSSEATIVSAAPPY